MKNQIRAVLVAALLTIAPLSLMAQYGGPGSIDINFGLGLGSTLAGDGAMPIGLSVDYGLNEEVTVGGYLGYAKSEIAGLWEYTHTIIGARATYSKEFVDNIHTYGGAMLGYNVVGVEYKGPGNVTNDLSAITYTAFVGARYHFTSNIGAYGEVGYGVSLLTLGLTYRL